MTMWEFADKHPLAATFMAFFAMWVAIEIVLLPARLWSRWLRRKNIAQHGWPKPPLDADGDVVHPKRGPDA